MPLWIFVQCRYIYIVFFVSREMKKKKKEYMVVHLYIQSWSLSRCLSVIFRGQYLLAFEYKKEEGSLYLDNFVFLPCVYTYLIDYFCSVCLKWWHSFYVRWRDYYRRVEGIIYLSISSFSFFFPCFVLFITIISNRNIYKKERRTKQMDVQKRTIMLYFFSSFQSILRLIVSCRIYFLGYIPRSYSSKKETHVCCCCCYIFWWHAKEQKKSIYHRE
jgi:hypothetical protein